MTDVSLADWIHDHSPQLSNRYTISEQLYVGRFEATSNYWETPNFLTALYCVEHASACAGDNRAVTYGSIGVGLALLPATLLEGFSGALAAGEKGVSVAIGDGFSIGAGTVVRTLDSGESASDVLAELRQLTYETNQEHALVRLANGEFQIQSGGATGIRFDPNVDQVLAHTHPYGLDAEGPSNADTAMLAQLSQQVSILLEHGDTILFGPDGTIAWH